MGVSSADDRRLIRDSARDFLADHSASADVRRWMETDLGYDRALWTRVAGELGWPGLPIGEDHGGLGLGWGELALLMEEMGASLFCSPFFSTVCLAATAIRLGGSAAQKAEFLRKISDGLADCDFRCGHRTERRRGCDGSPTRRRQFSVERNQALRRRRGQRRFADRCRAAAGDIGRIRRQPVRRIRRRAGPVAPSPADARSGRVAKQTSP